MVADEDVDEPAVGFVLDDDAWERLAELLRRPARHLPELAALFVGDLPSG